MRTYENTKVGDKITFDKVGPFWFTDMLENAKQLVKGQQYTVSKINIASSWTGVRLEETGESQYSLSWFN